MNPATRIFSSCTISFLLCMMAYADVTSDGQAQLLQTIQSAPRWVVLGFVSETESSATIDDSGRQLRMTLENFIQARGAEVLNLTLKDRTHWEQLWSAPYTGSFPKELIEGPAEKEKVNVISGSYASQSPHEITYLAYQHGDNKTHILHAGPPAMNAAVLAPTDMVSAPTKETAPLKTEAPQENLFLKRIATHRQEPLQSSPHRTRATAQYSEKCLHNIEKQLQESQVLKDYVAPFKDKPAAVIQREIADNLEQAGNSFMTSNKMELLSRAFALSSLLPDQAELQKNLLVELADHQDFSMDGNGRR